MNDKLKRPQRCTHAQNTASRRSTRSRTGPEEAQGDLAAWTTGKIVRLPLLTLILLSMGLQKAEAEQAQSTQEPLTGGQAGTGPQTVSAGMIQRAELNAEQPLFVPTHPRVTTTLRFPGPIGAPEGRGFTEDETKVPGEYLVAWTRGDSHLTVTPLAGAAALNLNVPFKGETYVIYFYPAERQFQALASLRLVQPMTKTQQTPRISQNEKNSRAGELPATRLLGLVDKIKLLRAVAPGKAQAQLAATLGLELSCPATDSAKTPALANKSGKMLGIKITHVARDPSMGALAFAIRLKNEGSQALLLRQLKFAAYCGSNAFPQRLAELPEILAAAEEAEAFIVIETEALSPLRAENSWQLRTNPEFMAAKQETLSRSSEQAGLQDASDKQGIP